MKTASFFTYKGPGRISISRGTPKFMSGLVEYKTLAPGGYFRTASKEEYTELFFKGLYQLDPLKVWNDLHRLAGGYEPVLLCYERPPFTEDNWCHRRMVASWIEETLGYVVPEIGQEVKQGNLF